MNTIITLIISVIEFITKYFPKSKPDNVDREKMEEDRKVADAIKNNDGEKIAEEYKKRKYYRIII